MKTWILVALVACGIACGGRVEFSLADAAAETVGDVGTEPDAGEPPHDGDVPEGVPDADVAKAPDGHSIVKCCS